MFEQFESMFKKQAEKITKSANLDLLGGSGASNDYSKVPQKFNINGRQIIEKRLLAEGAFGFIWIAQDSATKQQFALKRVICMTEEKSKSALLEKSLMQKIPSSPFIVKYYGGTVLKHDGNLVVVTLMELCPGGNLFDLLEKRENKGVPEDVVKTIARSILQGLATLHKAGFIHRDIKLENILIGNDKKMKICDFGSCTSQVVDFSKISPSDYESTKESIEAFTTPMYRPPQIVDPYLKYKITGKADLWMLGCVLYTMCYFVHPFVDASAVGIASATFKFPQFPNETKYQTSAKMQDFIRNLLTPNPEFRPSPEKLMELLDKWEDFTSIPLNQEAKRLKKEHEQKEAEIKKLNVKVSKYDGDIPIEQLMKLQQKLKNTNLESFEKQKISFISNKQTERISHGSSAIYGKPATNLAANKPTPTQSKKPTLPKESSGKDFDVWSSTFTSSKPSNNLSSAPVKSVGMSQNFDAFNDVFTNSSSQKASMKGGNEANKLGTNNNNFFQFFTDSAPAQPKKEEKGNKAEQVNLLDL